MRCHWFCRSISRRISAYLRVVSHDVIKACQQAQAGADLYMHGSIHIVEEVKSLVDQLAALLQETCESNDGVIE